MHRCTDREIRAIKVGTSALKVPLASIYCDDDRTATVQVALRKLNAKGHANRIQKHLAGLRNCLASAPNIVLATNFPTKKPPDTRASSGLLKQAPFQTLTVNISGTALLR
jgi:hypothetical protein